MRHLSLFSGVGMLDFAVEHFDFETVATAEIDPFAREVLEVRFPGIKHFKDVHEVSRNELSGQIDLVTGGFPCQDLSVAGAGAGLAGKRSGLWTEFARILREFEPENVLIENVAALRGRGLNALLNDLHYIGYDAWWDCIPAAAVGAPHIRDRMWIQATLRTTNRAIPKEVPLVGVIGPERDGVLHPQDGHHRPIEKLPRAGCMVEGHVYEVEPQATIKQCKAAVKKGTMLLPSPAAQDAGWRHLTIVDREGKKPTHPNQRFYDAKTGRVVQKGIAQIAMMFPDTPPAHAPLLPTPRASANEWRTLKGAPSHGKSHGATLAGTINDRERADGRTPAPSSQSAGNVNPDWVEWVMGLPTGWTNPDAKNGTLLPFEGWVSEPSGIPRTLQDAPHRRNRLRTLGNGLVPQVALYALGELLIR